MQIGLYLHAKPECCHLLSVMVLIQSPCTDSLTAEHILEKSK